MKKKILVLVLALTMALSLLPVTAMADGGGASTTYTVTFDANGATGPVPTQAATAEGGTFTLPSAGSGLASELKKNGYAFQGWYDGSNTYKKGATYTMPAHDVTFTAQWVSIKIDSYILLVSAADNSAYLEIDYTIDNLTATDMDCDVWYRIATDNVPVELNKDSNISISANSTYSGTLIDHFAYSDEIARAEQMRLHLKGTGSVADSADIAYCSMGKSGTVLSNIRTGCYVTLDNNYDGAPESPVIFVDAGEKYGTFEWVDASPSREGYTFLGYARTADATTPEYADDTLKGVAWAGTEVAKWYAVWEANQYTVTFDANGGNGTMADQTFVYDAAAQPLSANTFTKTGYTFMGWATTANGAVAYADNASVSNLATSGNVDLYAVWVPNTVEVGPAQGAKYFVEHYVEKWDGRYELVETEVLSGEIGTTVTADSTKYDDNAHHVNTAKSTLEGVISFRAADPMASLLTLKVYYDLSPYYGPVDTAPEAEIVTPKTADAGIFMAVSMSILSVTGSAVLLKKKED